MFQIVCKNDFQFFNAIEQMTQKGLGFIAHYESLTIELTGVF